MRVHIIFVLFLSFIAFENVKAKPTEQKSFLESISFEYKNGKWICGDVKCPEETFSCKIHQRTDKDDRKVLYQSFTCFDKDKNNLLGAGDRLELEQAKVIDINIESFVGAESVYSSSYGLGGNEYASGVVSADGLDEFRETARKNKENTEKSNA